MFCHLYSHITESTSPSPPPPPADDGAEEEEEEVGGLSENISTGSVNIRTVEPLNDGEMFGKHLERLSALQNVLIQ